MIMADIETLIKAFMAGCDSRNEEYQTESEEKSFNDWFNTKGRELCTDKWISVKDRLPEDNGEKLVADGSSIFVAAYYEDRKLWFDYLDLMYGNGSKATHWMPLHKPPKE